MGKIWKLEIVLAGFTWKNIFSDKIFIEEGGGVIFSIKKLKPAVTKIRQFMHDIV